MRATRSQMFMAMARAASTRSTCYRLSVGAIMVREGNVEAIGYNGASSGEPHCTGQGCQHFTADGCGVLHAEENAFRRVMSTPDRAIIDFRAACGHGTPRVYDLYVTHSPCAKCVSHPGMRYVGRVIFEVKYRDPAPIVQLTQAGVAVFQLLPSGLVVDQRTDQLCELP